MSTTAITTEPPASAPTVLVVDDVDDARDLLARLFTRSGYRAVTAADGAAALEAVDAENPAIVLLDLTMPDMDGFEVLRRLRADPRHRGLPVVLFTAMSDPWTAAEARRLGASDFVVKGSVGAADLIARVAHFAGHRLAA
jgi:CheY-like chemotaxis protein